MRLHLAPPALDAPSPFLDAIRAGLSAAKGAHALRLQLVEVAHDVGCAARTAFGVECAGMIDDANQLRVTFGPAGAVTIATLRFGPEVYPLDVMPFGDHASVRCADLAAFTALVIELVGRPDVATALRETAERRRSTLRLLPVTSAWNQLGGDAA